MRFSLFSLPLALSLLELAQAGTIEDNGYKLQSWKDSAYMIYSPHYSNSHNILDLFFFYPKAKVANIRIANNQEEAVHEKKLGLAEIYTDLVEMKGLRPDDMEWVVFDVEDPSTSEVISQIYKGRNIAFDDVVRIFPNDEEWNEIVGTQYYNKMLQVNSKPAQKILLSRQTRSDMWDRPTIVDRIHFSFSTPDEETTKGSEPQIQPPTDDKKDEAALKAMLDEEKEKESEFQVYMEMERVYKVLDSFGNSQTPASRR
ncbi:hypothetical protein CFO_g5499 [Ceratocystis platani]|uniref:Uncharacterized protein n=1 Tax=Ceratocystis fimbriata f. sp. platani TaxID=88771 RepID=A0A0F8BIY1_CERFI|nr:hypothetical protein CFO_g5499 [Ceratocystis platani]